MLVRRRLDPTKIDGAGGGGGSSFVAPAGTGITSAANPTSNGEAVITYDPVNDACPVPPTPPGPPGPDGGAAPGGAAVAVISQPNFTG